MNLPKYRSGIQGNRSTRWLAGRPAPAERSAPPPPASAVENARARWLARARAPSGACTEGGGL
eukprot:615262-Pleurochrysis_carterae.AAC.1